MMRRQCLLIFQLLVFSCFPILQARIGEYCPAGHQFPSKGPNKNFIFIEDTDHYKFGFWRIPIENLKNQLNAASKTVMGSGWGWLGWNEELQKLQIATTANQDRLEKIHGLKPLIGIDVWEHAYYLQYKNLRGEYLQQFWNVIDWLNVVDRFDEILFAKYSE